MFNSLSVDSALTVIRNAFGDFFGFCLANVSIAEIDAWVDRLGKANITDFWEHQKTEMKYPHYFLKAMFVQFKYITIREAKYRQENTNSLALLGVERDSQKTEDVRKAINEYALSLSFDEGVAYFGELVGAWMLTCPEASIKVDEERKPHGDWMNWAFRYEKLIFDERELMLLFQLDYMLFYYLDTWYDENNVFK